MPAEQTMSAAELEAAASEAEDAGRWTEAAALWRQVAAVSTDRAERLAAWQSAEEAEERIAWQSAATAAGARCRCGAPATRILDGTGGPCQAYPTCGLYPIDGDALGAAQLSR